MTARRRPGRPRADRPCRRAWPHALRNADLAVARRRAGKTWDARYTDPVNRKGGETAPLQQPFRGVSSPSCGAINKRHPTPGLPFPEETKYLAPKTGRARPPRRELAERVSVVVHPRMSLTPERRAPKVLAIAESHAGGTHAYSAENRMPERKTSRRRSKRARLSLWDPARSGLLQGRSVIS